MTALCRSGGVYILYIIIFVWKKKEELHIFTFTFAFIYLADAFIQSDLQLRNKTSDLTIKRQIHAGSACDTNFQQLFKLVQSRQGQIKERESFYFCYISLIIIT